MTMKFFSPKTIMACLATFFFLLCLQHGATVNAAGEEKKAPHFVLPAAVGDKVVDMNDFKGKVVMVNFWATWCAPCREEIPSLIQLQQEYGAKGFTVIGISMDEGGKTMVSRFVEKLKITYPVVMGDSAVARAFGGIIGIPQSFLIDREGNLVRKYPGFVEHPILERDVKALL